MFYRNGNLSCRVYCINVCGVHKRFFNIYHLKNIISMYSTNKKLMNDVSFIPTCCSFWKSCDKLCN